MTSGHWVKSGFGTGQGGWAAGHLHVPVGLLSLGGARPQPFLDPPPAHRAGQERSVSWGPKGRR